MALMPDDSPPVSAAAAPAAGRRRGWRWLRRCFAGLVLLLFLVWLMKVPLVNWALRGATGDYAVSIEGITPGFGGAAISGVRVVHMPSGKQLGYAPRVEVTGSWSRMIHGKLAKLTLIKPEVVVHDEFFGPEEVPPEMGPPATGVVSWEQGEIRGGIFAWIETGKGFPRLSMKVTKLDGGSMTIYNDGTVDAAEQRLTLDDLVSRESAARDTMEIETRSPHAAGVATAQHRDHRYTVESVLLGAPELRVVWHRAVTMPPEVAEPPIPRPAWDKPTEFLLKDGSAEPGRVMLTVHEAATTPMELSAALTQLHTAGLRAGGGLPFAIAAVEAAFGGIAAPNAGMEARDLSFKGSWDERSRVLITTAAVNGAAVENSSRLLAALGISGETLKSLPVCRTGLDAKCVNLMITDEGLTSPDSQHVVLKDFSALMPGEKTPIAQMTRVEVSAVLDEALHGKRLRTLVVERPELKIDNSADAINAAKPGNRPNPSLPAEEEPEWFGWHADSLTVNDGLLRASGLGTGIPDASGSFAVRTEPREAAGDSLYRIHIKDIVVQNPLFPSMSLHPGGVLNVDVHPLRIWQDRDVDQVELNGHRIELNDVFMKLFDQGSQEQAAPEAPAATDPPQPAPEKPATSSHSPWKVRRVVIKNSEVAIPDVGDGRRLVIPVKDQEFLNVPLGTDLTDNDAANAIQKVEVPGIYLYAPYNQSQTVVELPVNFIYFSFAGLLEKRLERVELVNPKIKAGKPLFDLKDRMMKRFSGDASVQRPLPLLAALDSSSLPVQQALQALRLATEAKEKVWDIPFFMEYGKIITAPNGFEWTQIPPLLFRNASVREGPATGAPIPFRLHGAEVHGELAIIPQWYEFEEYKLSIRISDEGRILFNFPLKDKDNNLVEVFRNNTILYKQLQIDKVWLSVTYDREGIYASFGGETCGGYITGKVNLYIDELYTWDASASFTGIRLKPLTGKLTREYVFIDGIVDVLNVAAYGDMTGLYQTTATLKMSRPGRLQVHALDELRRKTIAERVNWKDDAARIGIDLLRDFSFSSCHGTAKLFGREGKLSLQLMGSNGSRDFTVNLHDYRRHPDKTVIRF